MPTLFIGGAKTKGLLPKVLHALAAHVPDSRTAMIPNTTHPMFEQAPQKFSEIVLDFLGAEHATIKVNGYDMAYLDVGQGHPLVWCTARSAIFAPGIP